MPNFRNGYDERLDLTEDEWLEQEMYNAYGEYEETAVKFYIEGKQVDRWTFEAALDEAEASEMEGEPYEDEYFHGIPDYDVFGRPSWEE